MPQKDGRSLEKHLKAAAKFSQEAAAELAGPALPEPLAYIWSWFCELRAACPSLSSSMVTPGGVATSTAFVPISYGELESWERLTRRALEPWEVSLLRDLDMAWLGHAED